MNEMSPTSNRALPVKNRSNNEADVDALRRSMCIPDPTRTAVCTFRPIGYVRTDPDNQVSGKARKGGSRIKINPDLMDGLCGLLPGQRLVVVFCFHLSNDYDLMQHPRGDLNRAKKGVFALRSPRRPNPIGITHVDLVGIEGNVLRVRGLDAFDGTPVLDLKPE